MRKTLITLFCFCLGLQLLHAQRNPELSLDPSKAEWFREAKFGMFIHWGLYPCWKAATTDEHCPTSH